MLKELHIRNLAVVADVTLSFGEGLNVLSGSTGAGKSLILGAVNFLLGERAGANVIRAGEETAAETKPRAVSVTNPSPAPSRFYRLVTPRLP